MEYKDSHFKEQLEARAGLVGIKEAYKLVVKDIQDLLDSNPEYGYIIKLGELNLSDPDILNTLAEIRHAAGADNDRLVFEDGDFLDEETKYMLDRLGILDYTK